MPQPPNLLPHLDPQVGQELGIRQRIDAAGEHEVLPDQDAVAVAQVVERLGLVIAAAPDPDHVVVGRRRGAEQRFEPFRGHARRERVGRDPVGPLGEDGHAVDDEGERLAPFVGLAPKLERPQPDLERAPVDGSIARDQLDLDLIERLRAQTVGPPELRIGDVDRESGGRTFSRNGRPGGLLSTVRMLDAHDDFDQTRLAGRPIDLDLGGNSGPAVCHRLRQPDVRQPADTPAFDPHVLPDADVRQLRAPVPAEVAWRLTQIRAARERFRRPVERPNGVQLSPATDRRVEEHRDLVLARSKPAGHVPAPGSEHVVGAAQPLPVETDIGQRVQAVEDEGEVVLGCHSGVDAEAAAVLPVRLGDPLDPQLLVADERIGDPARGHQVGVDAARNLCREPLLGAALSKMPRTAERL